MTIISIGGCRISVGLLRALGATWPLLVAGHSFVATGRMSAVRFQFRGETCESIRVRRGISDPAQCPVAADPPRHRGIFPALSVVADGGMEVHGRVLPGRDPDTEYL